MVCYVVGPLGIAPVAIIIGLWVLLVSVPCDVCNSHHGHKKLLYLFYCTFAKTVVGVNRGVYCTVYTSFNQIFSSASAFWTKQWWHCGYSKFSGKTIVGGTELYTGHNFLHEVVHLSCLHKICSMPHRGWLGTLHQNRCYHVVLMLSIVLGAPFMTTPLLLLLPGWLTGSGYVIISHWYYTAGCCWCHVKENTRLIPLCVSLDKAFVSSLKCNIWILLSLHPIIFPKSETVSLLLESPCSFLRPQVTFLHNHKHTLDDTIDEVKRFLMLFLRNRCSWKLPRTSTDTPGLSISYIWEW